MSEKDMLKGCLDNRTAGALPLVLRRNQGYNHQLPLAHFDHSAKINVHRIDAGFIMRIIDTGCIGRVLRPSYTVLIGYDPIRNHQPAATVVPQLYKIPCTRSSLIRDVQGNRRATFSIRQHFGESR